MKKLTYLYEGEIKRGVVLKVNPEEHTYVIDNGDIVSWTWAILDDPHDPVDLEYLP